jgi:hydrogenase/urease accessory protein HupE
VTRRAVLARALAPTVVLAIGGTLLPAPADAHLVTTGLGPIYDGISHVLLSPDDLLPVLAMAALAGLNGPDAGRRTLFALTGAWLLAGIAGALLGTPGVPSALTAGSFLVLGALTAADRRLSPAFVATLAVVVGLLHGWLNGVGVAEAGRETLALAGIAGAVFGLVALAGACVVSLERSWARVAVRAAGSWVAAIGLLMLGWWLRGT